MQTKSEEIESAIIVERRVIVLIDAPTLVVDISSSKPRKRRKYVQKIEDGYDPDLDDYYMEDCFPKIEVMMESLS
jgi:predicted RNase H-like nuclease